MEINVDYERIKFLGTFNKLEDLTGQRFGRLTVLYRTTDYVQPNGSRRPRWRCKCDCGTELDVIASNLKRGSTRSCGCLQKEELSKRRTSHGGWANNEKLYGVWHGMKKRCYCVTDQHYKDYGERGITVCDLWKEDYAAFREWALSNGYKEGLSIDRINVDDGYSPDNCRWVTAKVQQSNRRSCIYVTYNGETKTLKGWSLDTGIPYATLVQRYNCGWETSRMLNPQKRPTD